MKLNKAHINLLRQNYEQACQAYLEAFCQKHGFHTSYWIANDIGGIADCNEFYSVDMQTIRTDIDEQAPEKDFLDWYEYCLDAAELHLTQPSLRQWLRGCPRATGEEISNLRRQKQDLLDAIQSANDKNG